jgi:hypothetical protein
MAPALTAAYDELIGPGRWKPSVDIGQAVVVRLPVAQPAVSAPDGFTLDGSDPSPVARAIVTGLATAD